MKYSHWIAVILILSLCISLVACVGTEKQNRAEPTAAPTQNNPIQQDQSTESDSIVSDSNATASDAITTQPDSFTEPDNGETKPPENPDVKPTESTPVPPDAPTEGNTKPDTTEPETTDPISPSQPPATQPDPTAEAYIAYYNMSGQEQQEFIDSFGSIEAFFAWHTIAKKAYEDKRTPIDGLSPIIP